MAEWKKVIVSGSQAQLAALTASIAITVGTQPNQTIGTTQATTQLSGSFTGSFKGDGSGLSGIAASFPTVPTTNLSTTDQIFVSDGSSKYITYSNLILDLAGSGAGTSNLTTTDAGDSLALTSQIAVTGVSSSFTGSLTGALIGTASWATNAATVPYSGLTGTPAGIVSASVLSSPSQGNAILTTNGVAGSTIDLGLTTAASPTFTDLTLTGGDLIATTTTTFNLVNTNQTTVNFAGAATAVNIGASTGITTINHDTRIKGTLYVDGTVTAISSSNLYIADQFILLASGSATNTDGGIIIDRGSYAGLNIGYGFDSTTGRWGYQAGITDTTNTFDPTGISGSFAAYVFTETSHGATKPTTGEFVQTGASYISTAGDIWIYA